MNEQIGGQVKECMDLIIHNLETSIISIKRPANKQRTKSATTPPINSKAAS